VRVRYKNNIGDRYKLNNGVEVTVINLKPLTVEDELGNRKEVTGSALRSGCISWKEFGIPAKHKTSIPVFVGSVFKLYCGVVVTVVEYIYSDNIIIEDSFGNRKRTSGNQLRKGSVSWAEFGVRTPTNTDNKVKVGDRIRSKRHGFYEIIAINHCHDIRITWDDYEITQKVSVTRILENNIKPKCKTYLDDLDNIEGYYVYIVRSKTSRQIIYVGKGIGRRLQHVNSGTSHNYYLNKFHFSGEIGVIEVFKDGLTEAESFKLEKELIQTHQPYCNISLNPCTVFDTEII
jgi:hypothetical protein